MSTLIYKMRPPHSLRSQRSFKREPGKLASTPIEKQIMPSLKYNFTSETKPKKKPEISKPGTKSQATLEGMPDELKICILQEMPDLDSLFTFLSGVLSYDCCYARYRQAILHSVLLRELGAEVFFEARAVVESRKLRVRQGESRMADVREYIQDYQQRKDLWINEKINSYPLDVPILLQMTSLHYHVGVITYNFARTALSVSPLTGKLNRNIYEQNPPSRNEIRRIQRALYRFELFVVLFRGGEYGMWYPESYQPDAPFFDPVDITEIFFSMYQTWEVAEIGCIRDFVMGTYDRIFRQCGVELEEMEDERDAFMAGRRRHTASVFLKHCARKMRRKDTRAWRTTHKKEFCLSQGLAFLHSAARAQTPAEQVSVLEPYYYDWYGGLSDALSEAHDFFSFRTANALAVDVQNNPLPSNSSVTLYQAGLYSTASHNGYGNETASPDSPQQSHTTFWDHAGDDASSFHSTFSEEEAAEKEKTRLPVFVGDTEESRGPNAIWPLTLGFCWDKWLRHWGYVMWDLERLKAMRVVDAPYYGRRMLEGSERRAGTMNLIWRVAKARMASPL